VNIFNHSIVLPDRSSVRLVAKRGRVKLYIDNSDPIELEIGDHLEVTMNSNPLSLLYQSPESTLHWIAALRSKCRYENSNKCGV
jgi:NAD kinase